MSARLRAGRGPSPLYCGACGGRIAEMRPDSCVNGTAHTPETDMEHTQVAPAADVDPVSASERILGSSPRTGQAPAAVPAGADTLREAATEFLAEWDKPDSNWSALCDLAESIRRAALRTPT